MSPIESEKPASAAVDETKKVGRGAIYLTFTKFWFMISGYIIQFALPRIFGNTDAGKGLYGIYSNVNNLSSVSNALVVQGTTQAVARFSGKNPEEADGVRRAGYRLQAFLGGGIFLLLFFLAPYIAASYGDPGYTIPLRIAASITLFYAFYAIFMGYMNGTKRFAQQAIVDFSYSTLKVVGVVAGAAIGMKIGKTGTTGVAGAIAGFAGSACAVMILGYWMCGRAKGKGSLDVGTLFRFQIFTMLSAGASTWLLRGDQQIFQWVMKSVYPDTIDELAGDYAAAMAFATIPYQAVVAITFVLFPLVSATDASDRARMGNYVRQTTRYAAIIASMLVALFVACPERSLLLLFPDKYLPAAAPLRVLALGYFSFSVFYIALAIFTASGRPTTNLFLTIAACIIQGALCPFLSPSMGLTGAATSTLIAMTAGLFLAHFNLKRHFGAGLPIAPILRIVFSGAFVGLVANTLIGQKTVLGRAGFLDHFASAGIKAKLLTVVIFGVCAVLYVVALIVTGALEAEDRAKFKKIIKR